MKNQTRKKLLVIRKWGKDVLYIIVGCVIMAMGTSLFLLPNKLSSGGFSGIATIIYYIFKIPLGITIIILNIPLFIMSLIRVRKASYNKRSIRNYFLINFYRYI